MSVTEEPKAIPKEVPSSSPSTSTVRERVLKKAGETNKKTEEFEFFGEQVYFHRPSLRELQANRLDDSQNDEATAFLITKYLRSASSNQPVFEETDMEIIMDLPFCPDTQRLQSKVGEFLGLDLDSAVKNSVATTGSSPS